jgi:RNA ligase (TIGR02306 family)
MRKMASIRKIDSLRPIVGADAIECAIVGGWTCVVKKGEFKVGDLAVYLEIDSWVPTALAPFLSKGKEPRVYEGIQGERLRTVKLRGQLSQGLLLPVINDVTGTYLMIYTDETGEYSLSVAEGDDVSEALGIVKWEMPLNAQLAGQAKGNYPTAIPKTDQERCQNLVTEIDQAITDKLQFEVTEKLEGSSMTVYLIDGVFGVCSRNLDLKETTDNTFWQVARRDDIESKMRTVVGTDFAIQGELIGPGIQGNIYKLSKPEFRVFDVYNISGGFYVTPNKRQTLITMMGLLHVPVIAYQTIVPCSTVDELLTWAEGPSAITPSQEREGVVFKQVDGGMTFKSISNRYLLKSAD